VIATATDDVGTSQAANPSNTVTDDATPTLAGTAEPLSTLTLKDSSGNVVGTTQTDAAGKWSLTVPALPADGTYTYTATTTDAAGNVSVTGSYTFTVEPMEGGRFKLTGDKTPTWQAFAPDTGTLGTPGYLSPEQALGTAVDQRSDLYSAGVVFYELLTGGKLFRADSPAGVVYQHIHTPPPRLPASLAWAQPLLDMLLAKSPEARLGSADELLQGIAEWLPPAVAARTAPTARRASSPALH
jgi:serine/threonine protein kinase